ncbi:MAG: serine hydrolase [Chloroflexaceae bacterium]|nr:serine hydrolase [Chloroflexaceae bacterium]
MPRLMLSGVLLLVMMILISGLPLVQAMPPDLAHRSPQCAPGLRQTMQPTAQTATLPPFPEAELQAILNPNLGTFAVMVYDEQTGTLIVAQQPDRVFYSASLIKLPIAMALYHLADEGLIDLNEELELHAEDIVPGSGSMQQQPIGTRRSLGRLCAEMLYEFDNNTVSNMILERIGFDAVNNLMDDLGATQTHVERLFFDFTPGPETIETSPADMLRLLQGLSEQQQAGNTTAQVLLANMFINADREKIAGLLPPGTRVMNRSGFVPGIEHDAGVVETLIRMHAVISW